MDEGRFAVPAAVTDWVTALGVAAGADTFTGLQIQHFDDLLTGSPTLSVQFDFGDSFIHHPADIDPFEPPRWTMPPELAGVLRVHNDFPLGTAWRPNATAATPAPAALVAKDAGPFAPIAAGT